VIEQLYGNRGEFFPIVPFADYVLHLSKLFDEFLVAGLIG